MCCKLTEYPHGTHSFSVAAPEFLFGGYSPCSGLRTQVPSGSRGEAPVGDLGRPQKLKRLADIVYRF